MTRLALLVYLFTWLSVATGTGPVHLAIAPPGLQFFKEKSVEFSCQGDNSSSEWIIMRHTFLENTTSKCGAVWGRPHKPNSCKLSMTLPWDTGVYWCQSLTGGIVSEKKNFTVSDTSTILHLDSTTTPPSVGTDMTLTCLRRKDAFRGPVYFYKDNLVIAKCPHTNSVTIRNISTTDEGFYKCSYAGKHGSPFSRISVVDQTTKTVSVSASSSNITRGAESLCEIYSLTGAGVYATFAATDASTVGSTSRDLGGVSIERPRPRDLEVLSAYDNLYAFLGGLVFIIMLLAVSYLVFRMYTVTRLNITRQNSVTPYTNRRRIVRLTESKVGYCVCIGASFLPIVFDGLAVLSCFC